MNTSKLIKSIFGTALMLGVAASTMLVSSGDAEAKRGGKGYYVQQYDVDRPLHGYEGHTFQGYYCSYKRFPKRVCTPTGNGGERCKIVGWTLEQSCG
ncbi:MAG: hypothetical protein KDJ47_09000 [Hyphomicrobiaceae bacterium]|nr:hypothetical protein [Hyphomicrobiaceae bacterium]